MRFDTIQVTEPSFVDLRFEITKVTSKESYFGSFVAPKTTYIYSPKIQPALRLPDSFFSENTFLIIPFTIHYDVRLVERSIYSVFDFIRDIGGLVSGINGVFVFIVAII